MYVDKDLYVPMRDGVRLAVDRYRPDELSVHAAVVLVTPYQKDAAFQMPLGSDGRPVPSLPIPPLPAGVNPMLLTVKPLVDAGFVVVVADTRGTGFRRASTTTTTSRAGDSTAMTWSSGWPRSPGAAAGWG